MMYMICCICKRIISDTDDYDRIDRDYYCPKCSNNNLVPCPVCETCIDPSVITEFQAPDGTLFCSEKCLGVAVSICIDCGNEFYFTGGNICPLCMMRYK